MSVLAHDFWPWFWALNLAGATVAAALSVVAGLVAQRRAVRRAASGARYGTPASAPGDVRTPLAKTSVRHEARPLARR